MAVLVALLVAFRPAHAQNVPDAATIQAYVKPEGRTLRLLVRLPLTAMPDMDYPRRGERSLDLLDVAGADRMLRDAATSWVAGGVELFEGDTRLPPGQVAAVMASLPSDGSFTSYDAALAHVTGSRLPENIELQWKEGLIDLLIEYPIQSDRSRFSIQAKLPRPGLRAQLLLRYELPGGATRSFEFLDNPGLVRLDPSGVQVALQFIGLGFRRVFDGTGPLLFLLCLAIPFRRLKSLAVVVTTFAAAHSITLIASAYHLAPDALWFPQLIETLIAASILYLALENIVSPRWRRRSLLAFVFGLVHGFGFSFALRRSLQLAGSHFLGSLLSFNIGLELGLLCLLVLAVPVLHLVFRLIPNTWMATTILSGLVAHTAWHWSFDRWTALRQYRFERPALDIEFAIVAVRWAMVLVIAVGVFWFLSGALGRIEDTEAGEKRDAALG